MRRTVQRILIIVVWLSSGTFLFAWSGFYNVAASSGHWSVIEGFLRFGMRHSVRLRAGGVDEPDLNSRDLIVLGAGHFERGCAFCHGSPDQDASPPATAMLPAPPSLSTPLAPWSDQELFWIVRHGIKYTGMPAWPALERADEVWAMIAFIKKLRDLDAAQYRALAIPVGGQRERRDAPVGSTAADISSKCVSCHGDRESGPKSANVPWLHGQREAFLVNALRQYASGARPSGIMRTVAAELKSHEIGFLAKYYSALPPPAFSRANDTAHSAHGRKLAIEGDPARRIPSCVSCHHRTAHDAYPSLDGQSAAYLAGQLRLWKSGHNTSTDGAAIMAPIAQRLTGADIEAVTRYFAHGTDRAAAEERP